MLKSRKRFGQHFLLDQTTRARIHDVLDIQPEHRVLEIGSGRGELTEGILQATDHLVAVEIDRDLSRDLRQRFPRLSVIEADALTVDTALFCERRIVGNLPYNISTPLLLRLTSSLECVDFHFMLQKEVVERLTAIPRTKAWGRLSVKVQQTFDVYPLFDVNPEAFEPSPRVLSTFVRLNYKSEPMLAQDPTLFDAILRKAFSQRRKTVANSLQSFKIDWERIGVSATSRADQLTIAEYIKISNESKC